MRTLTALGPPLVGGLMLWSSGALAQAPGLGPTAAPPPDTGACTSSLDALILDADAAEGVPEAKVEVRSDEAESHTAPQVLRADEFGRVQIRDLCEGHVHLYVSKDGHESRSTNIDVAAGHAQATIELTPLHEHHVRHVVVAHDDSPPDMAATEVISGARLAASRGKNLGDVVSTVSGVSTLGGSAGGMAKPIIRGQVGRRNLIIFDGVPHAGQSWGLDHAPEVDPNAAGQITVVKGAATTRYGPGAIGGALLVDPRPLPREPSLAGEASTVGYSNALGGGGAFRLDHAPVGAPGFAWRVHGNIAKHRAAMTPDYPLDNTGSETWNLGTKAAYLSEIADLELGYRLQRSRAGICSCMRLSTGDEFTQAVAAARPVSVELYSPEFKIERPRQEIWHHLALARTRVRVGEAGELHAGYAYQFNDRREYDTVRDNVTGPQLSLELGTHDEEIDYELAALELGRGWAMLGTLGAHARQQANAYEANTTLVPDYQQWSGGVYVVERFVHERIEIEFGGRYELLRRKVNLGERDYLGQRAGGRLDESACERDGEGAQCTKDFFAPSASAGVLLRPVEDVPEFNLRLDLNSSARVPAVDEQYMNGAAPSFPILGIGSSLLGVERTWGGNLTLQHQGDWFRVVGSAYANYIDDYIQFAPSPQQGQCAPLTCTSRGPFPLFAFEATNAVFGGGEVQLDLRPPDTPLEFSGNASWVRAVDLNTQRAPALVPANRYELGLRYLWPDTEFSSRGYAEVKTTLVDRQRNSDPALDFAAPPPAYVLLGAGAGVEFPKQDYLMRLSVAGHNLLNRRYREYTSLMRYFADQPGWGVQLRFGVEFFIDNSAN